MKTRTFWADSGAEAVWQSCDQEQTSTTTRGGNQERSCMDARVLFPLIILWSMSSANPRLKRTQSLNGLCSAHMSRPGAEKCRSPLSFPRLRDSQKTNKRLEGQRLLSLRCERRIWHKSSEPSGSSSVIQINDFIHKFCTVETEKYTQK